MHPNTPLFTPPPFRLLIFYCCVFFPFPPAFLFLSCMHAPCSASTTTSSSTVKFACCWVYVDLCVICLLAPPCRKTKPPNLAGSPNHVCDIASFNTSTEMCGLGAVTTRQRSGGRERERERERECVCVCVCVCARAPMQSMPHVSLVQALVENPPSSGKHNTIQYERVRVCL